MLDIICEWPPNMITLFFTMKSNVNTSVLQTNKKKLIDSQRSKNIEKFHSTISFCFWNYLQMLKHVHISPLRNRSDSISLRSSTSFSSANSSCATSLCGSPEPSSEYELKASSRSSSYSSLSESVPQVCTYM